jgi:hypothetical protein
MDLPNSKRFLYSASHLSSKFTEEEHRQFANAPSGALSKVSFLRALNIPLESHAMVREQIMASPRGLHGALNELLTTSSQISEGSAAHLALAQKLAQVPAEAFLSLAKLAGAVVKDPARTALLGDLYQKQLTVSPVGRLYLERLEMFPIGVERGEMVFTVPMAPGESTTISHKEWSVSSRGYEDVVQDFFESYSEKGVVEKTDTLTASENEVHQSNTLNFGATLSGSYGPVSLTTTLGVGTASDDRSSVKTSAQRNREVTQKSSARVRQEHKVSIKIESKQGVDQTSFKTITNPSPDAVRIDYYKMMRKWRTDLYRYGLRMTYDITVPSPGVRLWARWRRMAQIDKLLGTPLQFGWAPGDINEGWVFAKGLELGVLVNGPPPITITLSPVLDVTPFESQGDAQQTRFGQLAFDVPQGYSLATAAFTADMAVWAGDPNTLLLLNATDGVRVVDQVTSSLPQHIGATGHQVVSYAYRGVSQAALRIELTCVRQTSTFEEWQRAVWHQLHDAANARHNEELARLQEERDVLWRALVGKDTLSLRRLEREEMVRLIMLWLLGPDVGYANAPSWVETTVDKMLNSEIAFLAGAAPAVPSPTFAGIGASDWASAVLFGDMVKFAQEAVEWENLLYFLYPYFWGGEAQGRDKMLFEHPDPEHQNFLRAGYCRVVVTVRPGFEEDFTRFVETGSLSGPHTSPYLPIAEEIANKARTNYAGIPPANPEKHARPLLYPQQRQTWATMETVIAAIEQKKLDTGAYPASLADLPAGLTTMDAWGRPLVYTLPGSGNDYDLISLGSDGTVGGEDTAADISAGAGASLMASWFDYTPTSGVDIVLNTKADVIA